MSLLGEEGMRGTEMCVVPSQRTSDSILSRTDGQLPRHPELEQGAGAGRSTWRLSSRTKKERG
ncbi:hypothetical protein EON65_57255, partial [archaeon]